MKVPHTASFVIGFGGIFIGLAPITIVGCGDRTPASTRTEPDGPRSAALQSTATTKTQPAPNNTRSEVSAFAASSPPSAGASPGQQSRLPPESRSPAAQTETGNLRQLPSSYAEAKRQIEDTLRAQPKN